MKKTTHDKPVKFVLVVRFLNSYYNLKLAHIYHCDPKEMRMLDKSECKCMQLVKEEQNPSLKLDEKQRA